MGILRKILRCDVTEFPEAIVDFFFSFTFQVMVLATIYYGGMGVLIYYTLEMPAPLITSLWLVCCLVNAGFGISFPGLFYFNDFSHISSMFVMIALGPLTFPKIITCYLSFRWNVNKNNLIAHDMARMPIRKITTYRSILRQPVSEWGVDDPWMNAIRRNVDIGVPSFWDKCCRKWRLIVRIAKCRVF